MLSSRIFVPRSVSAVESTPDDTIAESLGCSDRAMLQTVQCSKFDARKTRLAMRVWPLVIAPAK